MCTQHGASLRANIEAALCALTMESYNSWAALINASVSGALCVGARSCSVSKWFLNNKVAIKAMITIPKDTPHKTRLRIN